MLHSLYRLTRILRTKQHKQFHCFLQEGKFRVLFIPLFQFPFLYTKVQRNRQLDQKNVTRLTEVFGKTRKSTGHYNRALCMH